MPPLDRGPGFDATPMTDESDVLELRDYLAVVRRHKVVVIATAALAVAFALAVSFLQTPVYQANAEVLLQSRDIEEAFSADAERPVRADPARVETEIGVMKSRSVREAVAERLGRPPDATIQAQGQTSLVTISAESTEPAEAAGTAQTYAEVFIETRRALLIEDLERAIAEVQGQIDDIEGQLEESEQRLAQFDARTSGLSDADRAEREAERAQLEQDIAEQQTNVETRRSSYLAQLDQLELASRITQTGGAQIVSDAVQPTSPVRPTPARNGVLALVVGLILGVGLAFLRDHLDDTIKTKDDLQAATGVTVLGLIPAVPSWKDRSTVRVISLKEPKSAAAEAYRTLRTSVQFIGLENPVKVIQFTSPNASEGKTTTLANLAVALAGAGQRIVVVCCDLRRPRVHEFLGVTNDIGFTSVLLGEVPLSEALQAAPGVSNVAVLASGPVPPNPSELLASQRTQELLGLLRTECDVLLIDTPPVLPVTDGLVVSRFADATIVVGIANRTTRHEAHRAVELLNQVGARVAGTVLNGVEPTSVYGYGRTYGHVYEAQQPASNGAGGPPTPSTNGSSTSSEAEPAQGGGRRANGGRGKKDRRSSPHSAGQRSRFSRLLRS
jgi:capsular exopolysaccharide synthesis family protein